MNMETISVSSLMNPKVKTVNEDKNIMSACGVMQRNTIGCVIVVTMKGDGSPVGIITEHDVVRILSKFNPALLHFALWKLMSKPLVTIEETASINQAIMTMTHKKIRRLVVLDKRNKMTGILTQKDIFKIIEKNPSLLTEFYGDNFSPNFKETNERFSKYRFENLTPDL
jgi:CBS domain-containing protein